MLEDLTVQASMGLLFVFLLILGFIVVAAVIAAKVYR